MHGGVANERPAEWSSEGLGYGFEQLWEGLIGLYTREQKSVFLILSLKRSNHLSPAIDRASRIF